MGLLGAYVKGFCCVDTMLEVVNGLLQGVDVPLGVVGLLVKEHRNGKQSNGGERQENGCQIWKFGFQRVPNVNCVVKFFGCNLGRGGALIKYFCNG